MTQAVDVVVIGAGAMGSATAWWLARRGHGVALLEQYEQGHTRGASHGGSRIFRLAYPDPAWVAMAQEALPLWHELEADVSRRLLVTRGGVDHGQPGPVGSVAAALAARGARHRMLGPAEAAERWPGMVFDGPVCYQPDAGTALADATVQALQARVADLGGEVRFGDPATAVSPGRRSVTVSTSGSSWRCRAVVVATGAWTGPLRAGAGGARWPDLPAMQVTEEQTFHFAPGPGAESTRWPSFIHHRRSVVYGLETPGEGVKVAEHGGGRPLEHPERRFWSVDPAARRRVRRYVGRWLPGLGDRPLTESTCLYTTTPDRSFVMGRRGNVVVGAGFSGHGFKFVPLVGRRLADLAGEALGDR